MIASVPGIEQFDEARPDIPVACAVIDTAPNEDGFILAGLCDAGDRLLGRPSDQGTSP